MADGIGIDYGRGQTNIDQATGIRYGVLPQNRILQAWADASEPDYGNATCPVCGEDVVEYADEHGDWPVYDFGLFPEYACVGCRHTLGNDAVWGDDPLGFYLEEFSGGERTFFAHCGEDGDIFIEISPFFTRGAFCSPCAPGAVYLLDVRSDGARAYCFGPDWFDEDDPCPYPVWQVSDGELVYSPAGMAGSEE